MNELYELGKKYGTDKASELKHNYTEVYNNLLYDNRDNIKKVLEIGINTGSSLYMWRDYFKNAIIYGIDINHVRLENTDRIITFRGKQQDRDKLIKFIDSHKGEFDIIIDDGSHFMDDQQISFGFLFKYVKNGGLYIIEDLGTSLDWQYERFHIYADRSNTTLNMIENFNKTKKFYSEYMNEEELTYLSNNVNSCEIHKVGGSHNGIICIIKKKVY